MTSSTGRPDGWTPARPTGPGPAEDPGAGGTPVPSARTGPAPRVLAAVASGVLVLAALGTAAAAGTPGDGLVVPAGAGVVTVGTQPGASLLGCPPPPVSLTAPEVTDDEFAAVQTPVDGRLRAVATGAAEPLVQAAPEPASGSLAQGTETVGATTGAPQGPDGDVAVVGGGAGTGGAAALSVVGPPGGSAPSLSALTTALTPDGDLRGLAASPCAAPGSDSWLVGGTTGADASTRLVLVNPGPTTAEVGLEVQTPDGVQQPPAGQGLVVPAGQRLELFLEGLVPEQEVLAVHVTSTGGSVAPSLVVSRLAGLVPRGVEVVVPSAAPSTRQVVPGLLTEGTGTAVLRVAVPGADPATVVVEVLADAAGADAAAALTTEVTVPARSVLDVPLGGVPAGAAGVLATGDVPVVASVVQQRQAGQDPAGEVDLAVAASSSALAPGAGLVLPAAGAGVLPRLLVTNGGEDEAAVDLVGVAASGGRTGPVAVTVPAGTTDVVDLGALGADLAAVVVAGTRSAGAQDAGTAELGQGVDRGTAPGGLHAALVLTAPDVPGAVAVVRPSSVPAAAGSTPVLLAPPGRWP